MLWHRLYARLYCASICLYFLVHAKTTYRVLIDSGSTGSRVYIYSYDATSPLSTLQEVEHLRVRPALATYYQKYEELASQLNELISFAAEIVPAEARPETHIALKATAGLRAIEVEKQTWLMESVRSILATSSFFFDPTETDVLSGEEEALYALLATNLAYGNLSNSQGRLNLAAADLGGSSTQIAFMLPTSETRKISFLGREVHIPSASLKLGWDLTSWTSPGDPPYPEECAPDYRLQLPAAHSSSPIIEIFARSIAGMGLVESMHEIFSLLSLDNVNPETYDMNHTKEARMGSVDADAGYDAMLFYEECMANSHVVSGEKKSWEVEEEEDEIMEEELNAIAVEEVMTPVTAVCDASHYSHSLTRNLTSPSSLPSSSPNTAKAVFNPCAPPGESLLYPDHLADLTWIGSGDFEGCALLVKDLVHRKAAREMACMKTVKFPTIVAIDNFPKSLEILRLDVDRGVTPAAIKAAGQSICQRPWQDIMDEFHHRIFEYRAQQACFSAAFIYTIATEFYGLADSDNTSFLPTDSHHSYTIGWPLGATVFAATNILTAIVP